MPMVSLAFFLAATVCGLTGMVWGGYMGAAQDFLWRDAHAHLNLVGWTTLSLMGSFYALSGDARPRRLAWINFALSTIGVAVFVPGLTMLASGSPNALWLLLPGTLVLILGMVSFLSAVILVLVRKPERSPLSP